MEHFPADDIIDGIITEILSHADVDEMQQLPCTSRLWKWKKALPPPDASKSHGVISPNQLLDLRWAEGEGRNMVQVGSIHDRDLCSSQSSSLTSHNLFNGQPKKGSLIASYASNASLPHGRVDAEEAVDTGPTTEGSSFEEDAVPRVIFVFWNAS